MALLEVTDLSIAVAAGGTLLPVVQGISFQVEAGKTLGIVGESGCGKSLTSLAIMGLLEGSQVHITRGSVIFGGQDLLALPDHKRRKIMGAEMAMIFQEPMTSLNPVYRVGDQIIEAIRQHRKQPIQQARARAIELLALVQIPDPEKRIESYPHQLSGGMRQRVMIAMALACKPDLLIADEPTTALDVTIQAQILKLLADLQNDLGMAILLITHNLSVVARFARRVVVMYAGEIAETADVRTLFRSPQHPYTQALLAALPSPRNVGERLNAIEGTVPMPLDYPQGCRFATRCTEARPNCAHEKPRMIEPAGGHGVACWLMDEKS